MGTFMLYLIVMCLLVMVYLLWEIRTVMTKQILAAGHVTKQLEHMSGQLGVLVRIQRSLAPGVAGDGWPNNED